MNKKFIVLSVLTLTACGTVFNGSSQSIHFESNVKNISIYANGALPTERWFAVRLPVRQISTGDPVL